MPKPPPGQMMVNFAELRLPEQARRGLAKGLNKPDLLETDDGKVECPHCKGLRPAICVVKAKGGWRCDGCITDERRRGVFEEW